MQAETKADHICENFSLIAGQYKKEDLLSGKDNGQGKVFLVSKDKRLFAAKLFLKEKDFKDQLKIQQLVQNVSGVMRLEYAKIAAQLLNYNNTIRLRPVIIMELGQKGDIMQFMVKSWKYHNSQPQPNKKSYFIPFNVSKAILYELLQRVQGLHQARILHRDLKIANIVLDENYHVRVVDYGLAASQDQEIKNIGAGTDGYRAPEVERCQYVGPQSDIFSCGVIFYTMCFLRDPFKSAKNTDEKYRVFYKAKNVQDLQTLWNSLQKYRPQPIEQGIKQFFLRIFKEREYRQTIPQILGSDMMATRASYEQMKAELHGQYLLFSQTDKLAQRVLQLKAQFEAELRDALMIQEEQQREEERLEMLPENERTRSAGLTKETVFYSEMKHFEKENVAAKKLDFDFEDSNWFLCSPVAALSWLSTYISQAIEKKQLTMLDFLDGEYDVNCDIGCEGCEITVDIILSQKTGDDNLTVRVEGKLFANSKGDKFKIQWYKKEGNDLLVTALLMDVKECTAVLYKKEQPLVKQSKQEKTTSETVKNG